MCARKWGCSPRCGWYPEDDNDDGDDNDDDDDGGNEDLPSVVNSRVLSDQIGMKLSPRQHNF